MKAPHKKVKWAKTLFTDWMSDRNMLAFTYPNLEISVISVKLDMTKEELNHSISRFLVEVRKQNGQEYPGATLYELVIGIQLYLASDLV